MRNITIVNQSSFVQPADLAAAVAALQGQCDRDLRQTWGGAVALHSGTQKVPTEAIYLLNTTTQADALGYHDLTQGDVPVGFVFVETTIQAGDHWQATLSHELLEQLLDPFVNGMKLCLWNGKPAGLAMELCDAVENDEYQINGIWVSNFILPSWFLPPPLPDARPVDFLRRLKAPLTLSPGGYVAYTTDLTNWQQTFAHETPAHQRNVERYSRRHRRFHKAFQAAA